MTGYMEPPMATVSVRSQLNAILLDLDMDEDSYLMTWIIGKSLPIVVNFLPSDEENAR